MYWKEPEFRSDSKTISPTLLIVLYFILSPKTVSVVAELDILKLNISDPAKFVEGYAVSFEKLFPSLS